MRAFLFIFLVFVLFSCKYPQQETIKSPTKITVTDALGRKVTIKVNPKKVMALAPSMTEYLAMICPKKQLVARTQNGDYPQWVKGLPEIVNYPNLDTEGILRLKPDLVITQKGMTPATDLDKLTEFGIPIYVFLIDSLHEVVITAERIGELTGNKQRGVFVKDSLTKVERRILNQKTQPMTALAITSTSPLFAFGKGSLVDEMMTKAGLENLIDSTFLSAYPQLDEEYILRKNPNVLLVPSTILWDNFFAKHPNLKELDAFKNNRLFRIESNHLSRQGPRIFYGLQEMKKIGERG